MPPAAPATAAPLAISGTLALDAALPTFCPAFLAFSSAAFTVSVTWGVDLRLLLLLRLLAFAAFVDLAPELLDLCDPPERLGAARFFWVVCAIVPRFLARWLEEPGTRRNAGESAAVHAGGALHDFEGAAGNALQLV